MGLNMVTWSGISIFPLNTAFESAVTHIPELRPYQSDWLPLITVPSPTLMALLMRYTVPD